MAAEHGEDFACRRTHHLAYAYFLAAVFRLKHREARHTDECDDEAHDGEYHYLAYESELLGIVVVEHVVEHSHLGLALSTQLHEYLLHLLPYGIHVGTCSHSYVENRHVVSPPTVHVFVVVDEEYERRRAVVVAGRGGTHIPAHTYHLGLLADIEQVLVHLDPVPLASRSFVYDVCAAVVFVEVAPLDDVDTHGAHVVAVDRQCNKHHMMLVIAPPPFHILVAAAQHKLRVCRIDHSRQLQHLGAQCLLLTIQFGCIDKE